MTNGIDPTDLPIPSAPRIVMINQPYCSGYIMGPSQVYCFPIIVGMNQRVLFNIIQTSLEVQDYTLACWFSTAPFDPVLFYSDRTFSIHLSKHKAKQFALQDINYNGSQVNPPPSVRTIAITPGMYYYNIDNLTNYKNKFEFRFTAEELAP